MLKSLRSKKVMKITMWVLVVIFALWGVGSLTMSGKIYAGKIFGRKISIQDYNRSYTAVLTRAKMMYGDKLPKLENYLDLKGQAWDRLILEQEAKRKNLKASNKEVTEKIASFPFFQQNGVFDERLYMYIVGNVFQTTPHDFEESMRTDIAVEKLMNSVAKEINVTDDEIRKSFAADNELASVSFLLLSPDNYKKDVTVNDDELEPYYNSHMEIFRILPAVDVAFLRFPFGEKKDDARYKADDALAAIRKGDTLEKVSGENAIELKETGLFAIDAPIPGVGISYPFLLTAIGLQKNQVSETVEGSDAFYIIQLKNKVPASQIPFDEAKPKVKETITDEKAMALAEADVKKLAADIAAGSKNFDSIAKERNEKIYAAKDITRKGYIEEIGPSNEFMETAFSLKAGSVGGPAKTQKGLALIRLDSLQPIDEAKLEKEKENIRKSLSDEKKQELFQKWFLELKQKAAPVVEAQEK